MLINQILNTIVDDIKNIIKVDCSIWNLRGRCLVSTQGDVSTVRPAVELYVLNYQREDSYTLNDVTCFAVREEEDLIFAIHQKMENVEMIGKLCVNQILANGQTQEKKVDHNRFIQQLLLDNMLLVDIYSQAKKLNFKVDERRVVYVIEPKRKRDEVVFETLKGMCETTTNVVTSVEEGKIVLVKEMLADDVIESVQEEALAIIDVLQTEAMTDVRVSYGTIVSELKDVSKSYKEALMALDVGRIFYKEKKVLAYSELGIGRLIHQLPVSLCEMFLQEVFQGNALEQFDDETLATVNAFFENNLNISETSRQMYLHRNTLSYRLDKIMKTTGLDVKKFDDALTFKIALMVSDHMKFIKKK